MNLLGYLKNLKVLMFVFIIPSVLLTFSFVYISGVNLWFWISAAAWLLFFFAFIKFSIKYTAAIWMIVYLVVFGISTSMMVVSKPSTDDKNSGTESVKQLSAEECKPYFDKYNGRVLKIMGDGLVGTIGIKINQDDCRMSARYIVTFDADIPMNPYLVDGIGLIGSNYNYILALHTSSETQRGQYGVGAMSEVSQNAMSLPDPFSDSVATSNYYWLPNNTSATSNFYWSYEVTGQFSEEKYKRLFDRNVLEVIDGLSSMEDNVMDEGAISTGIDHERAELEGTIVKTIKLVITE